VAEFILAGIPVILNGALRLRSV